MQAVVKIDKEVKRLKEDIETKKWRMVADQVKSLKASSRFLKQYQTADRSKPSLWSTSRRTLVAIDMKPFRPAQQSRLPSPSRILLLTFLNASNHERARSARSSKAASTAPWSRRTSRPMAGPPGCVSTSEPGARQSHRVLTASARGRPPVSSCTRHGQLVRVCASYINRTG